MDAVQLGPIQLFASGFVFAEAPRWHDGSLWLSDVHAHCVIRLDDRGSELDRFTFDDRVSGLGFLPNGDALVVSMTDRLLLRFRADHRSVHADLHDLCDGFLNDMCVDRLGRAYVNARNIGGGAAGPRDAILLVQPDGRSSGAADAMQSPNGSVVTDDGSTFIVAETSRARLTAFTIEADGSLTDRRVFASVPGRYPDGICIDAEGAIWFGSPLTEEYVRVREGGEIVATVPTPGSWAIACDLGGHDGHTLFCVTGHNSIANLDRVRPDRNLDRTSDADGSVSTLTVPVPR
jgi:sugar lactone lactonase YvrE